MFRVSVRARARKVLMYSKLLPRVSYSAPSLHYTHCSLVVHTKTANAKSQDHGMPEALHIIQSIV